MRKLRVLVGCECSGRVRDEFAKRGWEAWSADILPSESLVSENYPNGRVSLIADPNTHHYQGDVRDLFKWDHPVNKERLWQSMNRGMDYATEKAVLWDATILHPPCTDLSYAGARWFKLKDFRRGGDGSMQRAADFFMEMMGAPSPLVAVENPHSIVQEPQWAGPPTQVVSPYDFGDPYQKGIHLWLKGLPPLKPTHYEKDYPILLRAATGGGSWRTDKAAERARMSAYEDSEGRVNRAKVRSRTFPGLAAAMANQWGKFAEEFYARR